MPDKLPLVVLLAVAVPFAATAQWAPKSSPSTFTINDIHFLDENTGFLGTNNAIYKTANGGATWTYPQYPAGLDTELLSSSYIEDIYFFDQDNGIMTGSGFFHTYDIIAKTSDGGASWHLVYSVSVEGDITRKAITSIAFLDSNVGFVVGGGGKILKTTNSGATWTSVTSPTVKDLAKILFIDDQTGFIAGNNVLLKTTDAGASWQTTPLTSFDIRDLHFLTSTTGIASTWDGKILNTGDGGSTWIEYPVDFPARLGKMSFQGQTGYIVIFDATDNKFILKTTDGGAIWEQQYVASMYNLLAIAMSPGGKLWTGGVNGKLFSSTNGGGAAYPIASFSASSDIFCQNVNYVFTNNGPDKYSYEWRVDGTLKSTERDFQTTFTAGSHTVELKALNGALTGESKIPFYADASVDFSRPLQLAFDNGVCQGSRISISINDPEWGAYKLWNGNTLVATDDYPGVTLQTPPLGATTTFRVTATRANRCGTVEIYSDATVTVHGDLRAGSDITAVSSYFCNEGGAAVQITSSKQNVRYSLYAHETLVGSGDGTGQTIVIDGPVIRDTTVFTVRAKVADGVCQNEFDQKVQIDAEKVIADFYLSAKNAALGEPVNVYNLSRGAINFQWIFNGAATPSATGASPPPVQFTHAGPVVSELRASSATGCTAATSRTINVYDNALLKPSCWATGIGLDPQRDHYGYVDFENSTAVAPDGDIIVTGAFLGRAAFDSKVGPDHVTAEEIFKTNFLARYSASGVLKWTFNTSRYEVENSDVPMGSQVRVAPDGSIYLLAFYGSFNPTFYSATGATANPYANDFIYPAGQPYLMKYSPDGVMQWVRSAQQVSGSTQSGIGDIALDASGNVFLLGDHVYKISPAGDVLKSVKVFDPLTDMPISDFAVSPDGSWYCVRNSAPISIRKYSAEGELEWENTIAGANTIANYVAAVDPVNNLVLSGIAHYGGETRFESKGEGDHIVDPHSFFMVKYDPSGKISWINTSLSGAQFATEHMTIDDWGNTAFILNRSVETDVVLQSQDGNNLNFSLRESPYVISYDASGNIALANAIFNDVPSTFTTNVASGSGKTVVVGLVRNDGVPVAINGDAIYSDYPGTLYIADFGAGCATFPEPSLWGSVDGLTPGIPLCAGSAVNVSYHISPPVQLRAGNSISILLSNETGTFDYNVKTIGTQAATAHDGIVQALIPADIPSGSNYRIRLWASDPLLLSNTLSETLSVTANQYADFTYSSTSDLVLQFEPVGSESVSYSWTIEGNTIEERSPVHQFSNTGAFNVCLTVKNDCGIDQTVCRNVTVTCAPVPTDFTYTVDGKTLSVNAKTNSANTITWDFGDGSGATGISAQHTFSDYGEKSVCVRSATECNEGIACKAIVLRCSQEALAFNTVITDLSVAFTNDNSPSSYASFEWNFGDGTTSYEKSPSHIYAHAGSYRVTLNSAGECSQQTLSKTITVTCTSPAPEFLATAAEQLVQFTNLSSADYTSFQWDFGDGTTSTDKDPSHHYLYGGTYSVSLTAGGKCAQQIFRKEITVAYPVPSAPTGLVASSVDHTHIHLQWNDTSVGEQSFNIEFKETDTESFQLYTVLPTNTTTHTVSDLRCNTSYVFRVVAVGQGDQAAGSNEASATTAQLPTPIITTDVTHACDGESIELTASAGFTGYRWSSGASTDRILVSSTGDYSVQVADGNCASDFSEPLHITFFPLPDASIGIINDEIVAVAGADQYQWYLNDLAVAGGGHKLSPEENGSYQVKVTANGCSATSMSIQYSALVTDIMDREGSVMEFYPTPADDMLTLRFHNKDYIKNPVTISLMSVTGAHSLRIAKLRGEDELVLNIAHLPGGMYILSIERSEHMIYRKLVIRQ